MLKEYNQQQNNEVDQEPESRDQEQQNNNHNSDIHDALMSTEEVKKTKTKTPSTGA